jgi:hypothetical protein
MSYDERDMTEFRDVSIAPPRVSGVTDRRYVLSLWFLPAAILLIVLVVREMSRMEQALSAEGEKAARVLVYDLPAGETIRVPLESGTEVIRIVAHARGDDKMPLTVHGTRILLTAKGTTGERKETLDLAVPGIRSRARAEEPDITVADPIGFDIDVHGIGRGELEVKLDSIDGAKGLLVRAYRRELLDQLEVVRRQKVLDLKREEHLALRSWEVDWSDLDDVERAELLEGRWRKVGLLRGSKELTVHALAISAGQVKAPMAYNPALITSFSLLSGEKATVFTLAPATLYVETENAATVLMKREDGSVDRVMARGRFELHTLPRTGVELDTEGSVVIRTDTPVEIEPPIFMKSWRATPTRPVLVDAEGQPRVVRLAVRRAVSRGWTAPVGIDLSVLFSTQGVVQKTAYPLKGAVAPSLYDRFTGDLATASEAPTAKLVTHVLLSPGKSVSIAPAADAIDVSLGELDPDGPPRTSDARPIGAPLPIATANDDTWPGFLPRRPTNVATFGTDETHTLRLARRVIPYVKTPDHPITRIVSRPSKDTKTVENRLYEKIDSEPLVIQTDGEPRWVTLRFLADAPCDVLAKVDGGRPKRRLEGLSQHITVSHLIHVPQGESTSVVVLGDDLDTGLHEISLTATPAVAWVHGAWIRQKKPSRASTAPAGPRWTEGDFND